MKTAVVLIALALPLAAHHSFNAEYDETKPVSVTGVVTKVEWQNPHVWFYVDEKTADGSVCIGLFREALRGN